MLFFTRNYNAYNCSLAMPGYLQEWLLGRRTESQQPKYTYISAVQLAAYCCISWECVHTRCWRLSLATQAKTGRAPLVSIVIMLHTKINEIRKILWLLINQTLSSSLSLSRCTSFKHQQHGWQPVSFSPSFHPLLEWKCWRKMIIISCGVWQVVLDPSLFDQPIKCSGVC